MLTQLLLIALLIGGDASELELVPVNNPYYREAISFANDFKKAILEKDYDALLSFTDEESKPWISKLIKDKQSVFNNMLFNDTHSAYNIIKGAKQLEIQILAYKRAVRYGTGTEACFYDKRSITPVWTVKYINDVNNPIYCLYFLMHYSENRHYIPYGFANGDPDD